jgi:hypothetical protein
LKTTGRSADGNAESVPIVAGLGTAALKGIWNFDDPVFDEIKRFCRELFE